MLRDRYEPDASYWDMTEKLTIEMEPELAEIDKLLDDDELVKLIRDDFSQRHEKTLETGRNSSPVEAVLRMLTVKRLYDWTYRETEWHVRDSLVLRAFCRIYWKPVPDYSTLDKWALTLKPETLHAFNERITTMATQLKVTRGRKVRTDGTVVETNIHYPTDSSLLSDGVRVLSRTLKQAKELVEETPEQTASMFRDRTRSARNQARTIANQARLRSNRARQTMDKAYRRLVTVTRATLKQARGALDMLQNDVCQEVEKVKESLTTFIPRVEQALEQTIQRVFEENLVPASEKIVSIFEPHSDIISRNKAGKPVEFGHKVWLDEVDGGVVSRWKTLEGNPPDTQEWCATIDHHIELFGKPPDQASADRGVYSPNNEAYADKMKVKHPILPKPGRKSEKRRAFEKQPWFRRGRRYHAGVEGRISVLKRKHGLSLCLDHGQDGFDKWVGWGVIANNLTVMGRTLAA